MRKFSLYFILFCSLVAIFSCNRNDSETPIVIRDFATQYTADIAIIEDYLNTHYIEVSDNQDVTIAKINDSQPSILSYLIDYDAVSDVYPQLKKKPIVVDNQTYFIYFLKLRADNPSGVKPSRADEVFTAYDGSYLAYKTETVDGAVTTKLEATRFEYVPFPSRYFRLDITIRGWREILPLFRAGTSVNIPGEPESFQDFGAGVIFVPSGFGYFNQPQPGIPSYSPLVFSFKLYDVIFADQDGDGVLSNDEDINGDGDFTNDDTDGDGIQNLYDIDDDGDGFLTRNEIKINGELPTSYSQILVCPASGLKIHLDPDRNCN